MRMLWGDKVEQELKDRMKNDAQFKAMFHMVYATIANGDVAIQDWRDAVNLAYTTWHANNAGPIAWAPEQKDQSRGML